MSSNPTGTQTIRARCVKFKLGTGIDGGGSNPSILCQVFDGATELTVTGGTKNVSSAFGEWITWTFDATSLPNDQTGAGINFQFTCTDNGGGPNKRHVAIDSVEWQAVGANAGASYDLDVYENGSKAGDVATGTITSTTGELDTGTWAHTLLGTADGSLVELYITQTGGTEYLEIGAVEWQAATQLYGYINAGNSSDGVSTLDTDGPAAAPWNAQGWLEVYSESPTVVPDTTEYARVGFGVSAGDGTAQISSAFLMVLEAPNAGYDIHAASSLAPFNPHYQFRHLLTR
jgi:hypothetical protein